MHRFEFGLVKFSLIFNLQSSFDQSLNYQFGVCHVLVSIKLGEKMAEEVKWICTCCYHISSCYHSRNREIKWEWWRVRVAERVRETKLMLMRIDHMLNAWTKYRYLASVACDSAYVCVCARTQLFNYQTCSNIPIDRIESKRAKKTQIRTCAHTQKNSLFCSLFIFSQSVSVSTSNSFLSHRKENNGK